MVPTLYKDAYSQFLREKLQVLLDDIPISLGVKRAMWFKHAAASVYFSIGKDMLLIKRKMF